jgi:hypothetical protein
MNTSDRELSPADKWVSRVGRIIFQSVAEYHSVYSEVRVLCMIQYMLVTRSLTSPNRLHPRSCFPRTPDSPVNIPSSGEATRLDRKALAILDAPQLEARTDVERSLPRPDRRRYQPPSAEAMGMANKMGFRQRRLASPRDVKSETAHLSRAMQTSPKSSKPVVCCLRAHCGRQD